MASGVEKKSMFKLKCNGEPAAEYLIIVGVEGESIPKVLERFLVFPKLSNNWKTQTIILKT